MAENIKWMNMELLPDLKLIIWAANLHVAKSASYTSPTWMGERLSTTYADNYFSIAFQKGNTNKGDIRGTKASISFAGKKKNKFDAILALASLINIEPYQWITPCN